MKNDERKLDRGQLLDRAYGNLIKTSNGQHGWNYIKRRP